MSASLDVRQSIRSANGVFRRFPVQVSLPLILAGLASQSIAILKPGASHLSLLFILLAFLLALIWVMAYFDAVVATMYLRVLDGDRPGGKQFGEVLGYRGLISLAFQITLRCFGWALLFVLPAAVVGLLVMLIPGIVHSGSRSSGIGALAGGFSQMVSVIIGCVLSPLIFWRYTFAYPMFAIARGLKDGFLDECIARTRPVWKVAALVMMVESVPSALIVALFPVVWAHIAAPPAARMAVEMIVSVFTSCYSAWFILFKTGLALQLMQEQSPISAEPDTGSTTNLADDYIV